MLDDENSNGMPEPARSGREPPPCRECEELRRQLAELRAHKAEIMRYLGSLVWEPIEIDKEALLKEFGKEPSIEAMIAEWERAENQP